MNSWTLTFCLSWACLAKSLQSCLTLCDPIDSSPPGSSIPGILQARTLKWVAISFSNAWKWKVKVKSLSCAGLSVTPWTAAYQAPLSTGFSRQEYWSGVPLPSPWACLSSLIFFKDNFAGYRILNWQFAFHSLWPATFLMRNLITVLWGTPLYIQVIFLLLRSTFLSVILFWLFDYWIIMSLLLFTCSVVSYSLWPHGL